MEIKLIFLSLSFGNIKHFALYLNMQAVFIIATVLD